jgi:hypothetical protein
MKYSDYYPDFEFLNSEDESESESESEDESEYEKL